MVTPRFRVVPPSSVDESAAQGCARDVVCRLALEKAVEVLARLEREAPSAGRIVLGADTLVAVPLAEGERILGKPADRDDARTMLRLLAGRSHDVWTGVAVATPGAPPRAAVERTEVIFRSLSELEIEHYLDTGEPEGKAGAYGIQGAAGALVAKIRGCYYNVVGLPLVLTARLLADAGAHIAPSVHDCGCDRHALQDELLTRACLLPGATP